MLVSAFEGKIILMDDDPQLNEFKNNEDTVLVSVSSSASSDCKLSTLFHESRYNRHWESNNEKDSHFIIKFNEPVSCERYQFTNGYQIPKWWILEGTNDPALRFWDLIDQKYMKVDSVKQPLMCNCFPQRNAKACPIQEFNDNYDNDNVTVLPLVPKDERLSYSTLVVPLDDPPEYDCSDFNTVQEQESYKYYRFSVIKNCEDRKYELTVSSFDMFTLVK